MISKVTTAEYRNGDEHQANACLTEGGEFFWCKILLLCELPLACTPVQLWKTHIVTAFYLSSSEEVTSSKPYSGIIIWFSLLWELLRSQCTEDIFWNFICIIIFVVVGWFQDSERYIQISRAFVTRQKGKKNWNKKAFPSGRHTFDWFVFLPQDLENCIRLREAQVRKIEDTIQHLQEECPSNVNDEDTVISNDSCFNQDLIKLSEKIRQQRGGVLDFEMVIKCKSVTTIIIEINIILFLVKIQEKNNGVSIFQLHFSGMSCDIPHHVSSYEMIDSLMVSLTAVLNHLPKPTLVTMARYDSVCFCEC